MTPPAHPGPAGARAQPGLSAANPPAAGGGRDAAPAAFSAAQPRVGAHVSIAGGRHRALLRARALGCEVVRIFTKNSRRWSAPPPTPTDYYAWRRALEETGFSGRVFARAGRLINLAATDSERLARSRQSLLDELICCSRFDLPFLVLHLGARQDRGAEAGLNAAAASLDWVCSRYRGAVRIALEFTANRNPASDDALGEIVQLLDRSAHRDRLAICLDVGRELRKSAAFLADFKRRIPWDKVVCLNLHVSRSRPDWSCFETLLRHPDFAQIPFCLEPQPGIGAPAVRAALRQLKSLRAAARP